jgi:hypothetical protein
MDSPNPMSVAATLLNIETSPQLRCVMIVQFGQVAITSFLRVAQPVTRPSISENTA